MDSSQVEIDVCILDSGMVGKSVSFCSRRILVDLFVRLNDPNYPSGSLENDFEGDEGVSGF